MCNTNNLLPNRRSLLTATALCWAAHSVWAQAPTSNTPAAANPATPPAAAPAKKPGIKVIPPPGEALTDADRATLTAGVEALGKEIDSLMAALKTKPELLASLPDVQIYHKAVRYALEENTFYKASDVEAAKRFLAQGQERAQALREGKTPWLEKPGLVALGYRSRVDDSVQPYGLVIPPTWTAGDKKPRRLDFFFHGRGENLTELAFIDQRQKSAGEFTPDDTFVLHPYGRFCNANRFAGETDLFEALADAKRRYAIDPNRVVVRGFSMGGGACWHFATHYAGLWAAAAPGAGFSETAEFTNAFGPGKPAIPWYEQTLWHLYDATDYAVNLAQCPTVAYSGEIDRQKQAADRMADAFKTEGMELKHVIGPQTGHKYHADSKKEINAFVDAAAAKGRDTMPARIRFTTWTLRYNDMNWVRVEGLNEHWKRARVDADYADGAITAKTENVSSLAFNRADVKKVTLDGQTLNWSGRYVRDSGGKWRAVRPADDQGLRKRPGMQGPIDDAFYHSFVFVRPTGTPLNPAAGAWVKAEMERAAAVWRRAFRGEVRVVDDTAVTDGLVKTANLVLWGDPQSNAYLKRIAGKLPVRWDAKGVQANGKNYAADRYAPAFVYPNPNGQLHYVVVNSGFTFAQFYADSNAQHSPKLPDWAVLDMTLPADDIRAPGKVADAGFFDESWKFKPAPKAVAGR